MKKYLKVSNTSSYGRWLITTEYYGKKIQCTTTNSMAVDNQDKVWAKRDLINEAIQHYKNFKL